MRKPSAAGGAPLKKAQKEGRTIIFIDESGISQRPHRVRTWSRRGETPVLQYNFNWDTPSVAGGITFYNFYFRLYQGSVKSAQVVEFLQAHSWTLRPPQQGDSRFHRRARRAFVVEYLPGYAPELNPVEYIWAYWKQHALPMSALRTTGVWTRLHVER